MEKLELEKARLEEAGISDILVSPFHKGEGANLLPYF